MRILVAEDDADLLSAISAVVKADGFSVTGAGDGEEALELYCREPFPIVLTDWAMPKMDGMELLRAIRSRDPDRYCYVILLTGRDDLTWEAGMEAGADDFLTKPYRREELLARLKVARRIMNLQLETARATASLLRINDELNRYHDRVAYELKAAVRVQQSLLPAADIRLPGVTMAWALGSCSELAGDVCHAFEIDDRHLCFYVLDVSGHGVSAALLSAQVSRLLTPEMAWGRAGNPRGEQRRALQPSEVIRELNDLFQNEPTFSQYFTLVYMVFDRQDRVLRFSCAGHPGPVILRDGERPCRHEVAGRPIGLLEGGIWEDVEIQLTPGDRWLLFTDGLTEATDPKGEPFETGKFLDLLESVAHAEPSAVCRALMEEHQLWCGSGDLQDDCTVMVVSLNEDS